MASSSNQTLPCPSVDEENNDLDFADIPSLFNKANFHEFAEKIVTDPGFIRLSQELHRSTPTSTNQEGNLSEFDQEQFTNTIAQVLGNPEFNKMRERLHNYSMQTRQKKPIEDQGNTAGALENFAECVAQMEIDPELKPILAEIDDTGPAAFLKFWDDKYVLKKLSKAICTATLGDVEEGPALESDGNEYEEVSQGRKVLKIICEHAYMKNIKVLQDARAKRVDKKKTTSHHASNFEMEESDAVTLQNMDSETPIDDVA